MAADDDSSPIAPEGVYMDRNVPEMNDDNSPCWKRESSPNPLLDTKAVCFRYCFWIPVPPKSPHKGNMGALIIRMGFWGGIILYL